MLGLQSPHRQKYLTADVPTLPALATTVPSDNNRMHHVQVDSIGLRRHHQIAKSRGPLGLSERPGFERRSNFPGLLGIALLATKQSLLRRSASAVKRGAEWLATMQNADGSLGVCASLPQPGWATPYAILLWSALDTLAPERQRAAAWLLAQKGLSPARPRHRPITCRP